MVTIEPATLRDVTWIGAHMQTGDIKEILCQCPPDTNPSAAAAACWHGTQPDWRFVARYRGTPACAFGLMAVTYPVWLGWAFGTGRMWKTMPAATGYLKSRTADIMAAGCRRIEVRALKNYGVARLWIARLGGKFMCDLPDCGNAGETFELWQWTATDVLRKSSQDS